MIRLLFAYFLRAGQRLRTRWPLVLLFFFSLFCYATAGFMFFELPGKPDLTWLDAAWWAVVTMTTVGYGDFFPETMGGRLLVGFPTMLVGVSILGYILSCIASVIVEAKMKELKGMKQIKLSGHIILCRYSGLEAVLQIIEEIRRDPSTRDAEIVLIDETLEELPPDLGELGLAFVSGDPSREAVLKRANFQAAAAVIILAAPGDPRESDHRNLAVALTCEALHPDIFSVVECTNPENAVFFRRANCDSIVCMSSLSGQMLVQELQDPGVHSIVSELLSNRHGKQFYLVDIPRGTVDFEGLKSRLQTESRILLGIQRDEHNLLLPKADLALEPGDRAILIAAERPT